MVAKEIFVKYIVEKGIGIVKESSVFKKFYISLQAGDAGLIIGCTNSCKRGEYSYQVVMKLFINRTL